MSYRKELDSVEKTNNAVLTNHNVVRDGSAWWCRFCKRTWPYPQPIPADADPCVPRRWGDGR